MDVKMGTGESSQSSELGAIAGLTNQPSFHQQSPNVARLIQGENSSKMEYEFPISDVPVTSTSHHHHGGGSSGGTGNHSIISANNTRHGHSPSHHTSSSTSQQPINHSGHLLGNNDNLTHPKIHQNQTSNLWLSLTSCFGCRARGSHNSSMNPLRDKVHAIRIVRASNDLTPAVFDSHYNIITLEQLRECDNNGSGNTNFVANDSSDPLPSQNPNPGASAQNGNGSVIVSSSSSSTTKKDNSHRMRKKKKKRAASPAYASKTAGSDDDDDDERSGRT